MKAQSETQSLVIASVLILRADTGMLLSGVLVLWYHNVSISVRHHLDCEGREGWHEVCNKAILPHPSEMLGNSWV